MKNPPAIRVSTAVQALCAVCLLLTPLAKAELPEPDNVLYGTITLDNVPITAARTDVVVEARNSTNGLVASYRMGTNPRIGSFYALEISLESLPPLVGPAASLTGQSLVIVVQDISGRRGETPFTVGERGHVQRLDFGTALTDSDADTLPDAWELFHFGNLNQGGGSIAPNGLTALQNFIAGSDPSDTNGLFKLNVGLSNNQSVVSFPMMRAQGPGYEGKTRFYSLETSLGLTETPWTGVANFTNLLGNNQPLFFRATNTTSPTFYRARAWLQGP